MPRIKDLSTITPQQGDFVAVDQAFTGGVTGRVPLGVGGGLPILNSQGGLTKSITSNVNRVHVMDGVYVWSDPNQWVLLARWTGFSGNYIGLFADLRLIRLQDQNLGANLRVACGRDGAGNLTNPQISLSAERYTIVSDALLVQTGQDTFELWGLFPWGNIYISGLVGTSVGSIDFPNPGLVSTAPTPPEPIPGGLALRWTTATSRQTFPGPGYIWQINWGVTSGYIRYDNGVQEAWATISVSSTATWVYPAAFASTPTIIATPEASAARVVYIASCSATSAVVEVRNLAGNQQSATVHLYARGLWK